MGKVVAVIGLPTDINSSFLRGPAKAPPIVRAMIWSDKGNQGTELGGEIGIDFELKDRGDVPLAESEGDDERIEHAIAAILDHRILRRGQNLLGLHCCCAGGEQPDGIGRLHQSRASAIDKNGGRAEPAQFSNPAER